MVEAVSRRFLRDGIQRLRRHLSDCEPGINGWAEDKYPWILQMTRMEITTGVHGHLDWVHATETQLPVFVNNSIIVWFRRDRALETYCLPTPVPFFRVWRFAWTSA